MKKRLKSTLHSLTGKRSWRSIEYFDPSWTNRIQQMATYISPGKSVLDLGCGKMWLKQYLSGGTYYPVDYTNRGEGVVVCDFNKKEFPEQHADVAFVSGALEYVEDAKWFVSHIAKNCSECVISYCIVEDYPKSSFRRKQAWVNDFSRDQVVQLFSDAGFQLKAEDTKIPKNRIFYFAKA